MLGTSMGGAVILLCAPPLQVDARVLEPAYSTLWQAMQGRLQLHAGIVRKRCASLLASTDKWHLAVALDQPRPSERIRKTPAAKLLVAGDADRRTRLSESRASYRAAAALKELRVVHGATHVDLDRYHGAAERTLVRDLPKT